MPVGKKKIKQRGRRKVSSPAAGAARPKKKMSSGSGKIVKGGIKAAIMNARKKHKSKK